MPCRSTRLVYSYNCRCALSPSPLGTDFYWSPTYRIVVRSLHNNPLRLLVPRQRLLPPLRRLAPGKDLVNDLSDILDKDKLDARLDRVGHVFVNVGFTGDGDDKLFDACSVGC